MVRNVSKLYFPIKESIMSILPIVDEFVVALGSGDEDDNTLEVINSIGSSKIKIIHTTWNIEKYPNGTEHAHQTDIAMKACTGDWLFYLQADEVVHEKFLSVIVNRCREFLHDSEVQGLLFDYVHFWGDYDHHQDGHAWYKNEIRIVRNMPDIHSWESAQSFRTIPGFDGIHYRQREGTFKLKVAYSGASVYHYGWVRPPAFMQKKKKAIDTTHKGEAAVAIQFAQQPDNYDYGPMNRYSKFTGTHPAVMKNWIEKFDWADQLNYSTEEKNKSRKRNKHDKLKYRFLSFIEKYFNGGKQIGGFKNYHLLSGKKYRQC
jgi:hypothetical protein